MRFTAGLSGQPLGQLHVQPGLYLKDIASTLRACMGTSSARQVKLVIGTTVYEEAGSEASAQRLLSACIPPFRPGPHPSSWPKMGTSMQS